MTSRPDIVLASATQTYRPGPLGWVEEFLQPQPWMQDAACSDVDPEVFFPTTFKKLGVTDAAVRVCGTCPVRRDCLAYAVERDEREGIWGGTTPRQRRHDIEFAERSAERNWDAMLTALEPSHVRTEAARPDASAERSSRRSEAGAANNARRSRRAAEMTVPVLRVVLERRGDAMPERMRAVVQLRIEHPDASLSELGRLTDPPTSKDAVASLIRRALANAPRGVPA
ncbi:DNA-binding protein WhiA [Pseudolysinimonas sp.]